MVKHHTGIVLTDIVIAIWFTIDWNHHFYITVFVFTKKKVFNYDDVKCVGVCTKQNRENKIFWARALNKLFTFIRQLQLLWFWYCTWPYWDSIICPINCAALLQICASLSWTSFIEYLRLLRGYFECILILTVMIKSDCFIRNNGVTFFVGECFECVMFTNPFEF